jgi:predicted RNA-binding protein with PIN domain
MAECKNVLFSVTCMPTIIDGYNMLHAMGRLTARDGKHALEAARRWLLLQLTSAKTTIDDVTVVFDAVAAPSGAPAAEEHARVHFVFSHGQTADDLIEEIIRGESNSRSLTVVSDDHRIQRAARRRGCEVLGCLDYYERLQHPVSSLEAKVPELPAKPEAATPEETRKWLEAFADVEDDPQWRQGY